MTRPRVRVLGIDLASASWADNGAALVEFEARRVVSVRPGVIRWPVEQALTPASLASVIAGFCASHAVQAVAIDGPQGWRDPATQSTAPGVGRRCEYACRTQAKTGVFPRTYPGNQRPWVEFSVQLFDALLALPHVALHGEPRPRSGFTVLECFPTVTWRSSGLSPLPGKRRRPALQPFVAALREAWALPRFEVRSHDDLQAVVAALPAGAALDGPGQSLRRGVPAGVDAQGTRTEGFIWDAAPRS